MNFSLGVILACMTFYASPCHSQTDVGTADRKGSPLEFNIASIKRGKQLFTIHCVSCHGVDGRGDTEMREFLKTPPSDLSDDQWAYGDSEHAIFDVIKVGRTARDMPAFSEKLSDERTWQIVGYIKYLGGARP